MRLLALVFVVMVAALQYPMWLGKGGWLQVRETDRALDEDVHGLRVATRRASAALAVFGPIARKKDRRRTARTRATSSSIWNGLVK